MNLNYVLMILCTILYSIHTCLLRLFKQTYVLSSDLIACYQYLISIVILLPFMLFKGVSISSAMHKFHITHFLMRCSMIFCATLSWFYALSEVPAVNCIAISCITPIFILILAKISLHERLPNGILLLGLLAFIGAILIISPTISGFNFTSIFAVLTAFLWALNSVFTKKKLSPNFNSITIFFITAIVLSLMALPYVLIKSHEMNLNTILFLILITVVFDLANILLIWVFSRGKLALIAPFDFLRVVFTTLFAHFILNESISNHSVIGIGLILIANTLSTFYSGIKVRMQTKIRTV